MFPIILPVTLRFGYASFRFVTLRKYSLRFGDVRFRFVTFRKCSFLFRYISEMFILVSSRIRYLFHFVLQSREVSWCLTIGQMSHNNYKQLRRYGRRRKACNAHENVKNWKFPITRPWATLSVTLSPFPYFFFFFPSCAKAKTWNIKNTKPESQRRLGSF